MKVFSIFSRLRLAAEGVAPLAGVRPAVGRALHALGRNRAADALAAAEDDRALVVARNFACCRASAYLSRILRVGGEAGDQVAQDLRGNSWTKALMRSGMSSGRSRSGGRWIGTTSRR